MSISIRKTRLKKLEAIKKAGVNPYPTKTKRTHSIEEVLISFERFFRARTKLVLVGRIRSIREHGGSAFLHFEDGVGIIQAYFKRDKLGDRNYKFFLDNFDIGDFIEVSGFLFKTKKGEKTVEVSQYRILAKSLLPLPEKWHGLKDVEERFRKRYLDLIMNTDVRDKFKLRSKIITELRNVLNGQRFLEVTTPILQSIPGGALARPFKTYLNALKLNLYLRVSPELYLKRLLVGGFEKIYEIGRCFRNEGIDKHHNPDFTMLELYWAYQDKDGMMKFIEEMIKDLLKRVKGTPDIFYQGKKIHFQTPFKRAIFRDLIKEYCQIDIEKVSEADLREKLIKLGVKIEKRDFRCKLLDELYKKTCQPNLIQPTFVIDQPLEMAVLAKAKEPPTTLKKSAINKINQKDVGTSSVNKELLQSGGGPKYADRFQLVVGGIELINGFSELNDPLEQKKRFELTKIAIERRDKDFLEALEYGMPPAAGLGMGIDRLAALLTDSHSLREAILFPTMRPR